MPKLVYAQASPRSIGGSSLFATSAEAITQETAVNFTSEQDTLLNAATRLRTVGFDVLQISPQTINIAGPAALYEKTFNTKLEVTERPVVKEQGVEETAAFVDTPGTDMLGLIDTSDSHFDDVLEGIAIEEPRYFHASAFAPPVSYWHLDVPGDVSLGVNADKAHRAGITGKGVKVVMCDTGWYRHPFFVQRGYRSSPVVLGPGTASPDADENGHGTAESANVFAVAPDVDFTMVKLSFVNTIGGFNAAVGLAPQVISCSWGSSKLNPPLSAADNALAAAIALAVAQGIIVVFSAGNGHYGFPGQHPDVISAGGAYMRPNGTFEASNYASGFASVIYPGRKSPDVCGLVGQKPRAAYIMLPVQDGDQIDVDLATSGAWPNGDNTARNDGWAAISGTSAAAPQLAGVAALIKQACARLTPAEVKGIMRSTARDVTTGVSNSSSGGHPAGPGEDLATGKGVVDAHRAVLLAKVRCLGPIRPITVQPIQPITVQPIRPIEPIQPVQPIQPITGPIQPVQPITGPIQPIQPIEPIRPITVGPPIVPPPIDPGPREGVAPEQPRLSEDDVAALEELIMESGEDALGL